MDSNEQVKSEISQRISLLTSFPLETLKGEMQVLKKTIMENPSACLLLEDEDIGLLVQALRRMTASSILSSSKTKETKEKTPSKAKKLTPEELAKALEDEDF